MPRDWRWFDDVAWDPGAAPLGVVRVAAQALRYLHAVARHADEVARRTGVPWEERQRALVPSPPSAAGAAALPVPFRSPPGWAPAGAVVPGAGAAPPGRDDLDWRAWDALVADPAADPLDVLGAAGRLRDALVRLLVAALERAGPDAATPGALQAELGSVRWAVGCRPDGRTVGRWLEEAAAGGGSGGA